MSKKEKTLDESLDEIDKWSEKLVKEIEGLTPEQVAEYFKDSLQKLEKSTGRKLNISNRPAPRPEKV